MTKEDIVKSIDDLRNFSGYVWMESGQDNASWPLAYKFANEFRSRFCPEGYSDDYNQRRIPWSVVCFCAKSVCAIAGEDTEGCTIDSLIKHCIAVNHTSFWRMIQISCTSVMSGLGNISERP